MFRNLRVKMVGATMMTLMVVLIVIITAANLFNYREMVIETDLTLSILASNEGKFPESYEQWGQKEFLDSPELAYETRYFFVVLSEDGEVESTFTDQIAAVDEETAAQYAQKIYEKGRKRGFVDSYRYLMSTTDTGSSYVIFLDCNRVMNNVRSFAFASIWASLFGFAGVFIIMVFVSGRIVKPFVDNYEKQKRFITDAGHELKTPLAVIDADTEVLEMDFGENEWLTDIHNQTKHLTALTNDLIMLSRMQEKGSETQMQNFDLSAISVEIADSFRTLAMTQEKTLECDVEQGIILHGDEKAIRRLVSILLDNAVKYSEENGRIVLTVKKQRHSIRLSVYNTTNQINKESLPHLFDRFYRADSSRNSMTGGYGLGLSIAATTVSMHKGKIVATTEDGKSLLITATFPV